jgi:hypothetical protein
MAKKLLIEKPCVGEDFQLVVHADGTITHLDFDRCFETDSEPVRSGSSGWYRTRVNLVMGYQASEPTHPIFPLLDSLAGWYRESFYLAEAEFGHQALDIVRLGEADDKPGTVLNGTGLLPKLDTAGPVVCGRNKCAYQGAENRSIGYLAGSESSMVKNSNVSEASRVLGVSRARYVYAYAMDLERRFGIQHTLAAPPQRYRFTPDDVKILAENRTRHISEPVGARRLCSSFPYCFTEDFTSTVQPIHFVDMSKSLIIKFHDSKIKEFLQRENEVSKLNRTAILETLAVHVKRTQAMMEENPCLWNDFQVMVHLDGSITQLDLDRCFHRTAVENHRIPVLENLQAWYAEALDSLDVF